METDHVKEAVVLDMDGVIVDVSESYRKAIKRSIHRVYGYTINDDQIQKLKNAGGFNNDWDVTYALALLTNSADIDDNFDEDQWYQLLNQVGEETGLESAIKVTRQLVERDKTEKLFNRWDKKKLRLVFQELYLGSELFEELEDEPSKLDVDGYIQQEPILITEETQNWLNNKFQESLGVLTGRPRAEAEITLNRLKLSIRNDHLVAMEDWDFSKPNPKALIDMSRDFNINCLHYIGDTIDDIVTAINANSKINDTTFNAIGALTGGLNGESGRRKFNEAGADYVVPDVNALPDLLG